MATSEAEELRKNHAKETKDLMQADGSRSLVEISSTLYVNVTNEFARHLGVSKGDDLNVSYNRGGAVVIDEECIIIRPGDSNGDD